MADIFISCADVDREQAARFSLLIEEQGWSVAIGHDISGPSLSEGRALAEVDAARVAIVLWTEHSVRSRWVHAEAQRALQSEKLFPVRMPGIEPFELPEPFSSLQTPVLGDYASVLEALVAKLGPPPGAATKSDKAEFGDQPRGASAVATSVGSAWATVARFASGIGDAMPSGRTLMRVAGRMTVAWVAGLGLVGVTGLAIYGLAQVALLSLEPGEPIAARPGDAHVGPGGTTFVAIEEQGLAHAARPGATARDLGGHAGPVRQAFITDGGGEVISVGAHGAVRAIRLDGRQAAGFPGLGATLDKTLWQPFGRSLADGALWLAAQVVPLQIPEHAKGRRGRAFRDCKDSFCGPEMIELQPGKFLMGSPWLESGRQPQEGRRRLVTIRKAIAVAKLEATFDDWDACVSDGGCKFKPETSWQRGSQPVIRVSWNQIRDEYLPWINKKLGMTGLNVYRLPTEAEWEFAARAGTTTRFYFGEDISITQAQFAINREEGTQPQQTRTVGQTAANLFGLHDMHGNVWEWVQDCYGAVSTGETSQANVSEGCHSRVVRGGGWSSQASNLRSAARSWSAADSFTNSLGFRLGRTLHP